MKSASRIIKKIRAYFRKAGKKTTVVGLSGGVDSALVTALCARALGPKNVLGVLLPASFTPKKDMQDARALCKLLGIRKVEVGLDAGFPRLMQRVNAGLKKNPSKLTTGNSLARLRMLVLYAFASENNGLVAGTGDKSELEIGYFTKYGDGGCDFLPIGGLYKTEARKMALLLGIPPGIALKEPSPRLWKGHLAKGELGADYLEIDETLKAIKAGKKPKNQQLAKKLEALSSASLHKRRIPPIL